MAVEVPDGLRAAMEKVGVDPADVARRAQEIEDAGGVDAIPDRNAPARRIVEEVDRAEQETLADFGIPDEDEPDHPDADLGPQGYDRD